MPKATITTNPLHFEDLEPHRFEDLVRQLIYDFREWRSLEATGRTGSDKGFDARGWETIDNDELIDDEDSVIKDETDRLWLIQCKRERTITPKKMEKYTIEVKSDRMKPLYGVIFVAMCDFSIKTRDVLRQHCRNSQIKECHIWGKAELEDLLFQPKNDHLLFAYFGISLRIRQRSLKTRIRSRLSIKRKAQKHLENMQMQLYSPILLRDPVEDRYPFYGDIPDFDSFPRWRLYAFWDFEFNGLKFILRNNLAFLADNQKDWDFIPQPNEARKFEDPWSKEKKYDEYSIRAFWNKLPARNKARYEVFRIVPYDNIVDIDEIGDNVYPDALHIYVPFLKNGGPFNPYIYPSLTVEGEDSLGKDTVHIVPESDNQITYFPKKFPKVKRPRGGPIVT